MNKTLPVLLSATMLLLVNYVFAASPTIAKFTPAAGPVGSLVTITGTGLTKANITIGGVSAVVVSNTAKKLVGLVMPGAATGVLTITTTGGNVTSATSFTVRATPFPVAQQNDKLTGTGVAGSFQLQGSAVAISADGKTAVVGAEGDNGSKGAVWIYIRTGNNWAQQGSKLVGTGSAGTSDMGHSVAISADGNTVLVGGPNDNNNAGAVWVFVRKAGIWTQQGNKLIGTGAIGNTVYQGFSVSLSADGNTALAGAYGDSAFGGSARGATWVFTRNGTTWSQQGSKLVGTGGIGTTDQGSSVALSADGGTAIIGGYFDNNYVGASWIFTRSGSIWKQQGNKLVGTGFVGHPLQGFSVAISANGNTAVIGGYEDNTFNGAIWIFTRSGKNWSQHGAKLIGNGADGPANQGTSVAISADGNIVIEGGDMDISGGYYDQGALWVFKRNGNNWMQQGSKLVGTGYAVRAEQGFSVALSANGETALVGGPDDNNGTGAAWVYYSQNTLQSPQITSFSPASGAPGSLVTIKGNYLISPEAFTIGGKAPIVLSSSATQITAMVMPGATTGPISITTAGGLVNSNNFTVTATPYPVTQQGNKLTASDAGNGSSLGLSVAISADGNTAISGALADNDIGGAAIFNRTGTTWAETANLSGGDAQQNIAFVEQGQSVALSADGSTVVIGGPGDNNDYGAVWVFNNATGSYQQMGSKLVPFDTIGQSEFGNAVAVSADGKTIVAGGSYDDNATGTCWVFTYTNGAWVEQAKLVGTHGISGQFNPGQGFAVAISADGRTIIESSVIDNGEIGATWVFTNNNGSWVQQGNKLVGTGAGGGGASMQGTALALSADGNTAVVGAYADATAGGACWIFTRTGTTWAQQGAKLVGTGSVGEGSSGAAQGQSVSLSADGNTLVEGGNIDSLGRGAFWTFTRSGSTWTQRGNKMYGSGGTNGIAYQGSCISISADGTTTIEGGPYDNGANGAVWVFVSGVHSLVENLDNKNETESAPNTIPLNKEFSIIAYPNPFTNNFHLLINSQSADNIDIKMYNIYGQTVYATNFAGIENSTQDFSPQLPAGDLANGIYLVQVKQGVNSSVTRMVKSE